MKMIQAIIRPEREAEVLSMLETEGFFGITKIGVTGCGQQRGIRVGAVTYDELSKLELILAVEDRDYDRAVRAIEKGAYTGQPGDGKIFTQEIQEAFTIRTGSQGL